MTAKFMNLSASAKSQIMHTGRGRTLTSIATPFWMPRMPVDGTTPHEVIQLKICNGWTMRRAWRQYLGLTHVEMARRLDVSIAAFAAMEVFDEGLDLSTCERLADAMGITLEQLAF